MKKLYQIPLDADSAQAFIASLGLSAADFRIPPTSFQAVCQCWLSQSSAPGDMDQLVEALVSTRGLGRHTSCLCSPGKLCYVFSGTVKYWTVYVRVTEKHLAKNCKNKSCRDGSYAVNALRCDVWVVCTCIAERTCIVACFIGFWGSVFCGSASLHDLFLHFLANCSFYSLFWGVFLEVITNV